MNINFYAATAFINFVISAIFAVFVILKNRKDPRNITFFILASMVSFWALFYYIWQITNNEKWALIWCRALTVFIILIPSAYLHFTYALVGDLKKKKKIIILAYIISFLFLITDFTPYLVNRVEPIMNFKYWPMATPLMDALIFFVCSCIAYASILLVRKYRVSTGITKLQIKYVAIGFIISMIGGLLNFLPWFKIPFPPITNALTPVYVILMAYAITRYRLMDIRIITRQLIFYLSISFFAYALFYFVAWLYTFFLGGIFSKQGYLMGLFIAPLFAVFMYNGSKYLLSFINKYLFSYLYNYQQAINKLSRDLSRHVDLNEITHVIMQTIEETLRSRNISLLLADNSEIIARTIGFEGEKNISEIFGKDLSEYFKNNKMILIKEELDQLADFFNLKNAMERFGIYICLPLRSGSNLSGAIVLGQKIDDEPYTKEDIELLSTLSYQAGIAVDNALLYEKIKEKNMRLQELLSVKNDFIRIVNHQLNTPLSIMRDAYYMVKDKTITIKEGIGYWGEGVERINQILQNFWQTFELETEKTKIISEKTDISDIIKNCVKKEKNMFSISEKKIKISVEKPDFKIPFVWCESKKIALVVSNLLENAVFYTPEGSITINYELNDNNFLKISIKDTGIGFSKEDKEKLAQKFFRSKKAIISHPDGSGLGIYISKKIIEQNKGELNFESEGENKGSTFSFTVPVFKE